jgi:S1-C subfamily serine protease
MADDLDEEMLRRSVVKLFTVVKEPNFYKPWELTYQHTSGGSGVIIDGNRILTNAHVVAHQLFVQALKPGHPEKFTARVLHVDHDTETALLTVDGSSRTRSPFASASCRRATRRSRFTGFPSVATSCASLPA